MIHHIKALEPLLISAISFSSKQIFSIITKNQTIKLFCAEEGWATKRKSTYLGRRSWHRHFPPLWSLDKSAKYLHVEKLKVDQSENVKILLETSLPMYSTPSVLIGLIKCNVTHVTTSQSEIGLFCVFIGQFWANLSDEDKPQRGPSKRQKERGRAKLWADLIFFIAPTNSNFPQPDKIG